MAGAEAAVAGGRGGRAALRQGAKVEVGSRRQGSRGRAEAGMAGGGVAGLLRPGALPKIGPV